MGAANGGDCEQYHQPHGRILVGYAYLSHVLLLQMYINNLTTNTAYEVRIRAATQSPVGVKKMHEGEWSDTKVVFLQPGCEYLKQFIPAKAEDRIILLNLDEHLGMIAGIICGVLGLLSLILAILLCRYLIFCPLPTLSLLYIGDANRTDHTTTKMKNTTTKVQFCQNINLT
jgi:hypothetical protein